MLPVKSNVHFFSSVQLFRNKTWPKGLIMCSHGQMKKKEDLSIIHMVNEIEINPSL